MLMSKAVYLYVEQQETKIGDVDKVYLFGLCDFYLDFSGQDHPFVKLRQCWKAVGVTMVSPLQDQT